jgi:hypothetical protein
MTAPFKILGHPRKFGNENEAGQFFLLHFRP